jgi:hypothetical protein
MTKPGLNLTADDRDTDEAVNVAPELIENTMNNGLDPAYLSKYIDAEFLDTTPDALTLTMEQLEMERKEKVDVFDMDDTPAPTDKEREALKLNPREYQYELYQRALKSNIIAVLHTGSGKTLIAVMLIKQMARQEKNDRLVRHKVRLIGIGSMMRQPELIVVCVCVYYRRK